MSNSQSALPKELPDQPMKLKRRGGRSSVVRCSASAFILLASGCAQWIQHRIDQPTPIEPTDPVLIWSGDKVEKWHAVVITPDSVSGIPYQISLKCDSCRRSLPRSQVDSMVHRFKSGAGQGTGKTLIYGAGIIGAVLILEYVVCSHNGCREF